MIVKYNIFEGFLNKKEENNKYHKPYGKNFIYINDEGLCKISIELYCFDGLSKKECILFENFIKTAFLDKNITTNIEDYKKYKNTKLDTRCFNIKINNEETVYYIMHLFNKNDVKYNNIHIKNIYSSYQFMKYHNGELLYETVINSTENNIENLINYYSIYFLKNIDNIDTLTNYLCEEIENDYSVINDEYFKKCIEYNIKIKEKYKHLFDANNFDLL